MMDVGPGSEMNGGLITFMKKTDELGGTLQFLLNVSKHTIQGDNRNVPFIYFGNIEDGEVKSIPFLKGLLAETKDEIAWDTID